MIWTDCSGRHRPRLYKSAGAKTRVFVGRDGIRRRGGRIVYGSDGEVEDHNSEPPCLSVVVSQTVAAAEIRGGRADQHNPPAITSVDCDALRWPAVVMATKSIVFYVWKMRQQVGAGETSSSFDDRCREIPGRPAVVTALMMILSDHQRLL